MCGSSRGSGDGTRFEEARLPHRLSVGRLAEGLVPVVFVEESIIAGRKVLARLAACLLRGVRGLLDGFVLPLGALTAQVGGEVA